MLPVIDVCSYPEARATVMPRGALAGLGAPGRVRLTLGRFGRRSMKADEPISPEIYGMHI